MEISYFIFPTISYSLKSKTWGKRYEFLKNWFCPPQTIFPSNKKNLLLTWFLKNLSIVCIKNPEIFFELRNKPRKNKLIQPKAEKNNLTFYSQKKVAQWILDTNFCKIRSISTKSKRYSDGLVKLRSKPKNYFPIWLAEDRNLMQKRSLLQYFSYQIVANTQIL